MPALSAPGPTSGIPRHTQAGRAGRPRWCFERVGEGAGARGARPCFFMTPLPTRLPPHRTTLAARLRAAEAAAADTQARADGLAARVAALEGEAAGLRR